MLGHTHQADTTVSRPPSNGFFSVFLVTEELLLMTARLTGCGRADRKRVRKTAR